MSQNGYGRGGANPYDQRGGQSPQYQQPAYGAAPSPQYGSQQYAAPAMGRDEYAGQNVEMEPLAQNGSQFGRQADPNAILNSCRDIDRGIQEVKSAINALRGPQQRALDEPGANSSKELDYATSEIMAMFRNMTGKVKDIKQKPESGSPRNAPQVGKVDRDLKRTREDYLQMDAEFNRKVKDQAARQYRIVRPDATEQEVRQAVEDPNQQMFSQALMQSDRRGQSRAVLSAVQDRNAAIKKIESQMIELAEMFQDMDNLVVQQEAAVVNIEMKGEEVVDNMDKGNEQIGTAIQSARNTRKWKWWCLGICVLIIIIIVVVILIYKFVIQNPGTTTNNNTTTKRFTLSDSIPFEKLTSVHRVISGQPWANGAVVAGKPFTPSDDVVTNLKKFRRFAA
ncbi:Plasma membrane t-SNARE, secretory vesicle fusion [Cadophora gregata]|uniref:Plasma membrane t-SNARE, secretory vesicle fusion n=1 Tax=Cadophora gregata TaxID=51156 RepID=UPI0026DC1B1E|nr:Plasma membrane t-SNARE, secretory vesicle fusion [Cadophora gregata]KAK0114308.1 Plasma membrane t-SNARE, secretory vesicle fusion [Cadophora gregata]